MEAGDSALGPWALFVSAFVSATLAPGGSEAVLAWLVAQTAHDPLWLLVIATAGNTLGAVSTWLLGRLAALGYPLERFMKGRSEKALALVQRWGVWSLLLSWLPVVGDGLCLAAGWLRFPFLACLAAITAGKLLRYAAVVYAFLP
ncbi:MAG: DedA family protein [Pseudomonadota bacterium]|nr:DedA family protein [Pseudomonadota bacterium]